MAKYEVKLHELTEQQTLHQILTTLERMEKILESIESKTGLYPEQLEHAAEKIAAGIDHNTEKLSKIELTPEPEPKE